MNSLSLQSVKKEVLVLIQSSTIDQIKTSTILIQKRYHLCGDGGSLLFQEPREYCKMFRCSCVMFLYD
jgi:hypothetical protein